MPSVLRVRLVLLFVGLPDPFACLPACPLGVSPANPRAYWHVLMAAFNIGCFPIFYTVNSSGVLASLLVLL